jgi:hypothetical protein
MPHSDRPDLISFEDVAHHYLLNHAPRLESEMAWFAAQSLKLPEAIERACASIICGRVHSHQQRPFGIWPNAPKQASALLKPLGNQIGAATDFGCLHTVIRTKLAEVKGISDLGYYDIARRIGEWLRPKLEPREVYLHRGTREAAKAMGLRVKDRLPVSVLPEGLRSLTPAQAEDALCIYRIRLAQIASNGQGCTETVRRAVVRCASPRVLQRVQRPGRC